MLGVDMLSREAQKLPTFVEKSEILAVFLNTFGVYGIFYQSNLLFRCDLGLHWHLRYFHSNRVITVLSYDTTNNSSYLPQNTCSKQRKPLFNETKCPNNFKSI